MSVGERIKLYLVKNKIKQIEVSSGTGIDRDKLCQSLNGKRKLDADEFELIIRYLDVSADCFIHPCIPKIKQEKEAG